MNDHDAAVPRNLVRRILISAVIAAPLGAVAGYFVGRALKKGNFGPIVDWSLADLFGMVIGLMLLTSGAFIAFAATSARRWNEMVEKQPGDSPIDPAAIRQGRRSAAVAAIAGALMLVPPVAAHAGLASDARWLVAGLMALVLAVQSWVNWQLWRDGDELNRAVIAQTGAACFWMLQLALFIWATLTRLDLVAEVDSWSLMTVMMGVYLCVSMVVSFRRGLTPG